MARLTSPLGVVVNVSDEKAERLLAQGFTTTEKAGKAPAKRASSKSEK